MPINILQEEAVFPDFMIFRLGMLISGAKEIQLAGFFDNNWKLDETEMIQQ
jgi:hypothetical protein